ncbi:MAG TPA: hypothetical protein VFC87_08890 [Perlabentimonas sp.]|nr:hypothetical protein [Perlabentimonas sp.]
MATAVVTVAILAAFHLTVYHLFYTDSKTPAQHFVDVIPLYIYALIFPLSIVNSYKTSIVKVTHNGEVDPALVKDFF